MFCFLNLLPWLLTTAIGIHSLGVPAVANANRLDSQSEQASAVDFQVGFSGITKLGSWVPVFIESQQHPEAAHFEISVMDGDDQPITYSGELIRRKTGLFEAWARLGRQNGTIKVRLLDNQKKTLAEKILNLDDVHLLEIIPSTNRLILSIEPGDTVSKSLQTVLSSTGDDETQMVLGMDDVTLLPSSWLSLESISTMVIKYIVTLT